MDNFRADFEALNRGRLGRLLANMPAPDAIKVRADAQQAVAGMYQQNNARDFINKSRIAPAQGFGGYDAKQQERDQNAHVQAGVDKKLRELHGGRGDAQTILADALERNAGRIVDHVMRERGETRRQDMRPESVQRGVYRQDAAIAARNAARAAIQGAWMKSAGPDGEAVA
jgi:hypothetical protein